MPLGESVQVLLEIEYSEKEKFNAALEKIQMEAFACDEYFEEAGLSAYATCLGQIIEPEGSYCSEYALVDEENQIVYYIILSDVLRDEIEFDEAFIPNGYVNYGEVEK